MISVWFHFSPEIIFNLQISFGALLHTSLCSLPSCRHSHHLSDNYRSLVSILQTLSLFFHPIYHLFVQFFYYFFLWVEVFQFHNLMYRISSQHFRQTASDLMFAMKLSVSAWHSFALYSNFGFTLSYQYSYIAILLMSRINNELFIGSTSVLFIYIASRFSENHFVVWQFGSSTRWLLFLSVVTSLMSPYFLIFSIVFPKTELFINLKKSSKSFVAFVFKVRAYVYPRLQPRFLSEITLCAFFSFNPWSKCSKDSMCMT